MWINNLYYKLIIWRFNVVIIFVTLWNLYKMGSRSLLFSFCLFFYRIAWEKILKKNVFIFFLNSPKIIYILYFGDSFYIHLTERIEWYYEKNQHFKAMHYYFQRAFWKCGKLSHAVYIGISLDYKACNIVFHRVINRRKNLEIYKSK